jgi:iron(III) transport system permease protein
VVLKRFLANPWRLFALFIGLLAALSPVVVLFSALDFESGAFSHLSQTVLPGYIQNTVLLMVLVTAMSLLFAVPAAWFNTLYRFPLSDLFAWALILPLAFPPYIMGYAYTALFPNGGLIGVAVVLSLSLYPYVYVIARATFARHSTGVIEASQSLGGGAWRSFFSVSLPLARPALVAGVALALMETLSDYGTVHYYGVDTFTTGIFRVWFGMGDSAGAAQLSTLLMGFVLFLLLSEQALRGRRRYHINSSDRPFRKRPLAPLARWGVFGFCALLLLAAFGFPLVQLMIWASDAWHLLDKRYLTLTMNSFLLAAFAAAICVAVALLLVFGVRLFASRGMNLLLRVATLGYAVPGTVIAVGVMIAFTWVDHRLNDLYEAWRGELIGLIFSGTLFGLIFAYSVRFLAVAVGSVESGFNKIAPGLGEAARSLGAAPGRVLARVHLPLLKPALFAAGILTFIDVLKELPATIILRPFNFDTLSVRAYELASDEKLYEASLPALMIVLVGVIPVLLLERGIRRMKT